MYLKNEKRSDPRKKGEMKAMKATSWDSDSESEVDSMHICFMVQGDDPLKVNSKFDLEENDKLSYNDLTFVL